MNIRNILCFLALGLTLPLAACDDGDDGDTTSSDSNAESNDTTDDTTDETTDDTSDETGEPSPDVNCATFCVNYVELCLQPGKSSEFELYDDCVAACEAWDQAGVNCRNEQITIDACDQAGNMGSAC